MASEKTEVGDYDGPDAGLIGDLLYYDGKDWIRLHPGNEGQILTVVDIGGGILEPRWQNPPE